MESLSLIRPLICLAALLPFAAPARAGWVTDGVPLCTASGAQSSACSATDGAGGAIVAWVDGRSGTPDIYAQRVRADGTVAWAANGIAICTAAGAQLTPSIAADGSGGAFIVWQDARNGVANPDIYARHVDGSGTPTWSEVAVCSVAGVQENPVAVSDGVGGLYVAWEDQRSGTDSDIYAQRLTSTGVPQWNVNGVPVCNAIRDQVSLVCAPDGTGGLLAAWEDARRSDMVSDVYVQRLDGSGAPVWAANGVPADSPYGLRMAYAPRVVDDAAGGALVAWEDYRNGVDGGIYGVRVNASGAKAAPWDTSGSEVCDLAGSNQTSPTVARDGAGGMIVVWSDDRSGTSEDLYAQRMSGSAARLWTVTGVPVCVATGDQAGAESVQDGSGGALVAWYDYRGGSATVLYAQRITSTGAIGAGWTVDGMPVCTARADQQAPTLVAGTNGSAVVAWQDYRDSLSSYDIYAGRVAGEQVSVPTAPSALVRLGEPVPNPAFAVTSLALELPSARPVRAGVFDLSGRRVRGLLAGGALGAGVQRLAWDGADDAGTPVPAGVYFVRVEAGGPALVRRIVRLR